MKQQTAHSAKFLRERKFMLVLPLFVIPFLTVMFWLLGGGKVSGADEEAKHHTGLIMTLPEPVLKEMPMDKISLYLKADRDSIKRRERLKAESKELPFLIPDTAAKSSSYKKFKYDPAPHRTTQKDNEELMDKLAELNKALKEPQGQPVVKKMEALHAMPPGDIDRLEHMMQTIHQKDTGTDPELAQLNSIVEKLLEAQHPERRAEKTSFDSTTKDKVVLPVSTNNPDTSKLLIHKTVGFYSLEDEQENAGNSAIEAEVAETQSIINASTVKLRLLSDVYIKGMMIPAQSFVYGKASLGNGRLQIAIGSIQYNRNILPVSLTAYDLDGMPGIAVPNDISLEVAKLSAQETMQGINLSSLDPSIGAQAMSAGIEAGKKLFSKKVKQVKVELKEGYKLLLAP